MRAGELSMALAVLAPHFVSVALIAARLLPVAYLCPLFGGAVAPSMLKLGLAISLALGLHLAGGVQAPEPVQSAWSFAALAGKEVGFGVALGLVAGLPFDAARMGGRFIDLFRGASAEAALPHTGTRETASGDGLYQLVTAVAMSGVGLPLVLAALFRSFALLPLGGFVPDEAIALGLVRLAMAALAGGLAIGAPVAGLSLGVDCMFGLIARAAPQLHLQETGAPLKLLGGGALLWLTIGAVTDRALEGVVAAGGELAALLGGVP